MIEAFIRGDDHPSCDRLAAGPSLVHSRHPELRSAGHVSRAQQKLLEWFQSAKTARSVAHVAYWKEESEAK